MPRSVRIELNAVYLDEVEQTHGDVEAAIRRVIPWVATRIVPARCFEDLRDALDDLGDDGPLTAIVGYELLGQAAARPDVREWLCRCLGETRLTDGGRYQLAGAWSRLGVEARRSSRYAGAIEYARRGLDAVADLPPRAVTSNLYYNLGVALEHAHELESAIEAFEDSAEIDDLIGRNAEAVLARERIRILQGVF